MDEGRGFYTFRGYSLDSGRQENALSPGMEDYLEMIYRLTTAEPYTRVLGLANDRIRRAWERYLRDAGENLRPDTPASS